MVQSVQEEPGRKEKKPRLNLTGEAEEEVSYEPNDRTEAKWRATLAKLLRYVDDGFTLSKINFENSFGFKMNGVFYIVKHEVQAQNIFRHIVRRAEEIGMKVNSDKTSMICVSDALDYEADAFINNSDGDRIGCQNSTKALGIMLSSRPVMDDHCKKIQRTFLDVKELETERI